jgi:hypothetical protein
MRFNSEHPKALKTGHLFIKPSKCTGRAPSNKYKHEDDWRIPAVKITLSI